MIKKSKTMESESFLKSSFCLTLSSHRGGSREQGNGDQTTYSKNSRGFVPGRVPDKIWLVPKSAVKVTALCLAAAAL